jgi:hypothetical protein
MTAFTRPKRISLKNHPLYSESWVQDIIAEGPSILGLGDLVLRDRERIQARAGRLDLLLQDPETYKRYEVELQLGATDETTSFEPLNIGTLSANGTHSTSIAPSSSPRTSLAVS